MIQLANSSSLTLNFTLRRDPVNTSGNFKLYVTSRATNQTANVLLGSVRYDARYVQGDISVNAGTGDTRLDLEAPNLPGGFYVFKLVNWIDSSPEITVAEGLAFVSRAGTAADPDWDTYTTTETFKTYEP